MDAPVGSLTIRDPQLLLEQTLRGWAPADDLWERTTMRIRRRRVVRRAATAGVAALAMLGIVGTVAVLADDDDVGRLRLTARLVDVALGEARALRTQAVLARRRHLRPDAGVLRYRGEFGAVTRPG